MPAVIELEEAKTFQEVREEKTWLTSNEAAEYVIDNCPNILRAWGGKRRARTYRDLYKMVDTDRVISGKTERTSSGQRVRFYLKEDLDYVENLVYPSVAEEASLARRKDKHLEHVYQINSEIAKLKQKRNKVWTKYKLADYQLQLKEKGKLGRWLSYWNYCL